MSHQEAAAEPESPDLAVGEVYGLRSFMISKDGALLPLSAYGQDAPWESGVNTATCSRQGEHEVPGEKCTCGFYFYSDERWIEKEVDRNFAQVRAVIACSGRTRIGDKGFRTQRGRIVALWVSHRVPEEVVNAIQQRYPEATIHRSLRRMKSEFPLSQLGSDPSKPRTATQKTLSRWKHALLEEVGKFQVRRFIITTLILLLALNIPANQRLLLTGAYLGSVIGLVIISRIVTDRGSTRLLKGWGWVCVGVMAAAAIAIFLPDMPSTPLGIGTLAGLFASGLPQRLGAFKRRPLIMEGHKGLSAFTRRLGEGAPRELGWASVNGVICTLFEYPRSAKVALVAQSAIPHQTTENMILRVLGSPQAPQQGNGLEDSIRQRVAMMVHVVPEHARHGVRAETVLLGEDQVITGHVRALPLNDVLDILRIDGPVWVPEACRSSLMGAWSAENQVPGKYDDMGNLHLRNSEARATLEHAQALLWRKAYRDVQGLVALSGVAPVTDVPFPSAVPEVPSDVLARGWGYLLRMPVAPRTMMLGGLFLDVLPDLPVRVEHLEYDLYSASKTDSEQMMQVGHLVALERYSGALTNYTEPHLDDQWWFTSDPEEMTFMVGPISSGGHTTIRFSFEDGEADDQDRLSGADAIDDPKGPYPERSREQ